MTDPAPAAPMPARLLDIPTVAEYLGVNVRHHAYIFVETGGHAQHVGEGEAEEGLRPRGKPPCDESQD